MSERTKMYMKMCETFNERENEKLIASLGDSIYMSDQAAEKLPDDFIELGLVSFASQMSKGVETAIAVYEYGPEKTDVVFMFEKESKNVYIKLESEVGIYKKIEDLEKGS